ncbi:exopolysaccharide biosynthesis polyprenyl glycosylphosphotransferase [Qipengyuania sp. DGS5-3]|uniref:exopolysaccharide biosynthesis polyprenyl glycosylphosphotransferase n=1 Tax=Qipengyuania sp. DGS5-3 TaxID=3349632 RepID=UPI0036D43552
MNSDVSREGPEMKEHMAIEPARASLPHRPSAMRRENRRVILALLAALFDVIALVVGFVAVELTLDYRWLSPGGVPLLVIIVPAFLYFATLWSSYSTYSLTSMSKSFSSACRALMGAIVVVMVSAFLAKFGMKISRAAFVYAILASAALLLVSRVLIAIFVRLFLQGKIADRLLVTINAPADHASDLGMDVIDLKEVGLKPDLSDPTQMAEISDVLCRYDVVYLDGTRMTDVGAWVTALKATGVACEVAVSHDTIHSAVGIGRLGAHDTLVLSRGPLSFGSRLQKRAFDLIITVPLMIFLGPLMLLVTLAIRLESPGPALFRQSRIGQANMPFQIYKFRSMRIDAQDDTGNRSTARDDDRITKVGAFIRKTSIDELPQLINVLIGNMSLVGPRPHAHGSRAGSQLFWEVSELYWMRHALKPGITGLAQINGFRGATNTREDLEARLRYDLEYLQNWNLWDDFTILLATAKVVSHSNAY